MQKLINYFLQILLATIILQVCFIQITFLEYIYNQYYYRIMGGEQSKPQPQNKKPVPKTQQHLEVEGEKRIYQLDIQIKKIDDLINKKTNQAQNLEAKIKELIAQKKNPQAKQLLPELKSQQTQIQNFASRRKVLQNQKTQLQMANVDIGLTNTMGQANKFMKNIQNNNNKMEDILLDQKQIQTNLAQTNNMMNQLAGNQDQQQTNDLFKELQNQVNQEKAQKIAAELNKPSTNNTQKVADIKINVKNKNHQEDQIARMLNS